MIQGVSSDPAEDVAAWTPIANTTVTYHPVLEIWFHMQVFPFANIQNVVVVIAIFVNKHSVLSV